ncbi:MAG: hypothetical protein AAGJ35_08680, partial [Myxococcota bacterium]
ALFTLLLQAATPHTASATIIIKLSDKQMAQRADNVIEGRVLRVHSAWHKQHRRIFTLVSLAVIKQYKGRLSEDVITIRQVGGTLNSVGSHVSGRAKFNVGEEVIVFLERRKKQKHFRVMGMSYGKYNIVQDTKKKQRYLFRNLKGLALAKWKKGKFKVEDLHQHRIKTIPMQLFVRKLKKNVLVPLRPKVMPNSVQAPKVKHPQLGPKKLAPTQEHKTPHNHNHDHK